jgi:hypothetical protein
VYSFTWQKKRKYFKAGPGDSRKTAEMISWTGKNSEPQGLKPVPFKKLFAKDGSKRVAPGEGERSFRANNRTDIAGFHDLAPAGGMNSEGSKFLAVAIAYQIHGFQ